MLYGYPMIIGDHTMLLCGKDRAPCTVCVQSTVFMYSVCVCTIYSVCMYVHTLYINTVDCTYTHTLYIIYSVYVQCVCCKDLT